MHYSNNVNSCIKSRSTNVQSMTGNKITITIFNSFCTALIDTGCCISVMSEKLARRLKIAGTNLVSGRYEFSARSRWQ